MLRRYDVFVVDLDGTLLGSDGGVSPRNRRAVQAVRDAGITVIIATGRALVESRRVLEHIEHDGLVIAAGGAMLCDAATGRTLDRSVMPETLVRRVTESLVRHGHKALILKDSDAAGYDYLAVGQANLDPASQWWFEHLPVRVRFADQIEDDPDPHETVRAGAVAQGRELGVLARELLDDLGEQVFLQHWSAVTQTQATGSTTHLLEVFNPRVSKWTMIRAYCESQGIEASRVAAIGDEINDCEMIRHAGLGIAMGNAVPMVLDAADQVSEDHDHDGLALAVERILDGRW